MDDYPLWSNIDVIVEAHASGTGAEPPHSYAFTRCITKKVLRRTHDHVLELINNGTIARGTLLVTMVRVVLIILGVCPPTEPWADADACADSRSSRAHTQTCARVPLFRALVPLAGALLAMSLPFDYRVAAFEQITNFTNGTREPFRASPPARALPRASPRRSSCKRSARSRAWQRARVAACCTHTLLLLLPRGCLQMLAAIWATIAGTRLTIGPLGGASQAAPPPSPPPAASHTAATRRALHLMQSLFVSLSNPCCNRLQVHPRPPQVAAAGTAVAAAAAAPATAGAAIATIIAIADTIAAAAAVSAAIAAASAVSASVAHAATANARRRYHRPRTAVAAAAAAAIATPTTTAAAIAIDSIASAADSTAAAA